jgi:UDP-N-acetylglucosamine:LPS N-acetylglucosamine transferase
MKQRNTNKRQTDLHSHICIQNTGA